MDHAGDARSLPRSAAAFAALTELPRTTTALISGRALDSLRAVAFPPEKTLLIGSHGAEVWMGPGSAELELDDDRRELLAEVRRELEGIVEVAPGPCWKTSRPASSCTPGWPRTTSPRTRWPRPGPSCSTPGVFLKSGNRVLETSVIHASKGEGIAFLRQAAGATATIFAGDDTTDEDALARLLPGDVGVKVGLDFTQAQFRIEAPVHVAELLEALLRERKRALGV